MSNLIKIGKYARNVRDIFTSDRKGFYIKVIKSIRYIIRN
jgi:hypothetical protein